MDIGIWTTEEEQMDKLTTREERLLALGAAIASNCMPCIEFYIPEARKAGLSDLQIRDAVRIADRVRQVPARAVLEAALARLDESPDRLAETASPECGCSKTPSRPRSGRADMPTDC